MADDMWNIDIIEDEAIVKLFRDAVNREIRKALEEYMSTSSVMVSRWYEDYEITFNVDDDFEYKKSMSLKNILIECVDSDEVSGHSDDGVAKKLLDVYLEWENSYSGKKNPKGKTSD